MRPAQPEAEKVTSHGTGTIHVQPAASLLTCCYQKQLWLCKGRQTRGLERGLESAKATARETGLGPVEGEHCNTEEDRGMHMKRAKKDMLGKSYKEHQANQDRTHLFPFPEPPW